MPYREATVRDRALRTVGWGIVGAFVLLPLLACFAARAGVDLLPARLLVAVSDLVFGQRWSRDLAFATHEFEVVPSPLALVVVVALTYVAWWFAQRSEVWVDERKQLLVARTTRFPLPARLVKVPLAEVHAVRVERSWFLRRWVALDEIEQRTLLCLRIGGGRTVAAIDAHLRRLRGD